MATLITIFNNGTSTGTVSVTLTEADNSTKQYNLAKGASLTALPLDTRRLAITVLPGSSGA